MPRIKYSNINFTDSRRRIVDLAVGISEEYAEQGMALTLRQVHYQMVARGFTPNTQNDYAKLSTILNDARMAGLFDWSLLHDRTRFSREIDHEKSPQKALEALAKKYRTNSWEGQKNRVWLWVEKDAAIGVIESLCQEADIPYFATRGYPSVSSLWEMAQKARTVIENGQRLTILYMGDHDPSGLDISRDISERMENFVTKDWVKVYGRDWPRPVKRGDVKASMHSGIEGIDSTENPFEFRRIALNIDQIRRFNPPPNPAKTTDARFARYVENTGLDQSWELDALEPSVMNDLVYREHQSLIDLDIWDKVQKKQKEEREEIQSMAKHFDAVKVTLAGWAKKE